MSIKMTISNAGLSQRQGAAALGISLATLRTWFERGVPHKSAALAHMWMLGLAGLCETEVGHVLVPAPDLMARYELAMRIIREATTQARSVIKWAGAPVAEKKYGIDDKELTGALATGRIADMRKSRTNKSGRRTDEKAVRKTIFVYPSQDEELTEVAEEDGMSRGEVARMAFEEFFERRKVARQET